MITMTPKYSTITFSDIFVNHDAFLSEFKDNGIPALISDDNAITLFYLLYARYGNSPIAHNDINQFKYGLWSTIFQFGPSWQKELDIQSKVRALTEEEIIAGTKSINNRSYNPSSAPSTSTLEELETINEQSTVATKRGKLEAYQSVLSLLKTNVTGNFINQFKHLFKQFVMPERPITYISEIDEGE